MNIQEAIIKIISKIIVVEEEEEMKGLEEIMKKEMINHEITINYIPHEEGQVRSMNGILKWVSDDAIHMLVCDDYGKFHPCYLNKYGATLISIYDYGESDEMD